MDAGVEPCDGGESDVLLGAERLGRLEQAQREPFDLSSTTASLQALLPGGAAEVATSSFHTEINPSARSPR